MSPVAAAAPLPVKAGHVFVVRGTLELLIADDLLISTDSVGSVGHQFYGALGWTVGEPPPPAEAPSFAAGQRVFPLPARDGGPRRWLVAVGADYGEEVPWLLEGIRGALLDAVAAGKGQSSRGIRQRIAMPVMGVGKGGFNAHRGAVIDGLLKVATAVALEHGVDVVLVAFKPSDYSALQAVRRRRHDAPLRGDVESVAVELATHARNGRLALFMGAGTGIPAGLPSWDQLVSQLAADVRLEDSAGLEKLNPLDAAEVLRRETVRRAGELSGKSLGDFVVERIGRPPRYALSHILLAALQAEHVITTNFDQLYEAAVAAVQGERPPVVLPNSGDGAIESALDSSGWLLKLHGDVGDASSIVLDRRSFVRYDATRRPLGGVLQTTLLTKHLLVVGASMNDDNVIRLVHEVSALHEDGNRTSRRLGTVLTLTHEPLRRHLWAPEFTHVHVGAQTDTLAEAGRGLEIFLDRVALLAAPMHTHLLDPRYRELLATQPEKELADDVVELLGRIERITSDPAANDSWGGVAAALRGFGAA